MPERHLCRSQCWKYTFKKSRCQCIKMTPLSACQNDTFTKADAGTTPLEKSMPLHHSEPSCSANGVAMKAIALETRLRFTGVLNDRAFFNASSRNRFCLASRPQRIYLSTPAYPSRSGHTHLCIRRQAVSTNWQLCRKHWGRTSIRRNP